MENNGVCEKHPTDSKNSQTSQRDTHTHSCAQNAVPTQANMELFFTLFSLSHARVPSNSIVHLKSVEHFKLTINQNHAKFDKCSPQNYSFFTACYSHEKLAMNSFVGYF